ncbi:hypothetical protein C8Q80DRAFT_1216522 [Daedaleopsis nitida]|nr:hypothetical protein C8Q80DRAFT_1216522 [Daedaleopsis nitida]
MNPRAFNVLGNNDVFRESATDTFFNPTNTSPPFFQVFHEDFLKILGPSATIRAVVANPMFAFAHEALVWVPGTDEIFFSSNNGGTLGRSDIDHNNQIDLPDTVQMTNGGTGPFFGQLVLANSGRGPLPPSIALVNPLPPHNTTVLLDNLFGRQFNSLNDVKIHPGTNKLYGFLNHFRPPPLTWTRALCTSLRTIQPVQRIAFSPDGKTAFISTSRSTDTGANAGFLGNNQTEPTTIYAFDVDPKSDAFKNRRVFAYLDAEGNVYAGCGDGVQVWNSEVTLLGKFFLKTVSANLVFAGNGRLVIMAETAIFFANIAAKANKLSFP